MKNRIVFFLCMTMFFVTSCESPSSINQTVKDLTDQRENLQLQVDMLNEQIASTKHTIVAVNDELKAVSAFKSGREPKYILTLHLRQVSYSLSISKQIRDAANTVDFQIPVDAEYYNAVTVGQEIVDDFRVGSLIMRGTFGNWRITVKDKSVQ